MCSGETSAAMPSSERNSSDNSRGDDKPPSRGLLGVFLGIMAFDITASVILFSPLIQVIRKSESLFTNHYTLYGSLWDLSILSILRILSITFALLTSYSTDQVIRSPFGLYHRNGDRKSSEELEQEALEEPFLPWFRRYIARPAFFSELVSLVTGIHAVVKCFARLDVELGRYSDLAHAHPVFWVALSFIGIIVVVEGVMLDSVCKITGECGRFRRASRRRRGGFTPSIIERIGSHLSLPLLANDGSPNGTDLEQGEDTEQSSSANDEGGRGISDITGDSDYKAGYSDLFDIIYDDLHLIALAFVFLLAAAFTQIYIPRYTGNILDALADTYSEKGNDDDRKGIVDVPGFVSNVKKLVVMAILCGIFSGIRGSIFSLIGGRVNVRMRVKLMDSLLSQDIGFFDTTKTGDITSRLTSDTTLVGDQVSLNVNVLLRSVVQAIGVLIFMFLISWQLSLLAFISVPAITVISKWYGNYVRNLTKLMQKKLAEGNSVSDAAMGAMPTVRAFDAASGELKEFEEIMDKYLALNTRSCVAYVGYCACFTSLPQLVIAVVLFYGGLLVRDGDITSGKLVSFLLYLSSLSDAFSAIGYIFSSLTQAVGAADKVFELMYRKPRLTAPSSVPTDQGGEARALSGFQTNFTEDARNRGLRPPTCDGEISLENVELYYPARPQRRVLDGMTLNIPPGAVIALVGPSGSGKSSVMSLVQHLYEPANGDVCIDGNKVHDLSPQWLSRHVSIVSQEPTLFARSVRRNIMYGLEGSDAEPSDEEIIQAAKLANAHSFIEKLPFKYETDVGERGVQLSGGQKQRVAIARALVRKPRILLLDEATSALDAESEALVQEAIDDMIFRGRGSGDLGSKGDASMTVLIVAHRLSTVRNADIIFVVEDGRVVEQGSHEELIKNEGGSYASLISRQMNAQNNLENRSL